MNQEKPETLKYLFKESMKQHFLIKILKKINQFFFEGHNNLSDCKGVKKIKMAIICDICKENVTPTEETEIVDYSIIKVKGDKLCLCIDCESVLYEWIYGEEFKKRVIEHKKQFTENDRKRKDN